MLRSKFYVCPVCGNIIHSMGQAAITCHGIILQPQETEAAAASADRIQMVKLYPEGSAEARFKINGVRKICFYCNRDGLFELNPNK